MVWSSLTEDSGKELNPMEIWKPSPPEEVPRYSDKITICRNDAFPYLDLEMYWRQDELQFRVHLNPNQVLKNLNKDSAHTKATFQAILMVYFAA